MSKLATEPVAQIESPRAPAARPAPLVREWSSAERIFFRIGLIFSALLILPLEPTWYQHLAAARTLSDFFRVALLGREVTFVTIDSESGRWGLASFANWGIALAIAVAAAGVWTWFARKSARREYTTLYYWSRLLVRYWVGVNIMNYGFMKLFPDQMPFPSLTNLHTLFGEHAAYRTYWQVVGIVTWYEIVLGALEVGAGLLLFFRRTAALGALVNFGLLYNIAHANLAYDGGVQIHSGAISLLAGLLFLHYVPDLWRLLIKGQDVVPTPSNFVFRSRRKNQVFLAAKIALWVAWVGVYAVVRHHGDTSTGFSKEPRAPGLPAATGYYQVTEFKLNGVARPYSPLDPVRWHEVVFEDYSTLTYKVDRAFPIRLENGAPAYRDSDKIYELAGFAGGRKYLHYEFNTEKHELVLQDKSLSRGGPLAEKRPGAPKVKPGAKLVWHYSQPSDSRLIITGRDEDKNTLYVVLDRVDRNLPIHIAEPVAGQPLRYGTFERRFPLRAESLAASEPGR